MTRLALAAFALVFVTGAKCRREDTTSAPVADAAPEASVVASAPPAKVEAPAPPKPAFRRFDPASTFLHNVGRVGGGLQMSGDPEPLTPEQREKASAISKALSESDRPPEALAALRDDLADGLRKGRFDDAKLKKDREALATGMAPLFAAEATALNDLHAMLSPAQRAYVSRMGLPSRGLRVSGHATTDLCRSWTTDLDDAKKKTTEAALPAPVALSQSFSDRFDAVANAFAKETFDARKLDALDAKKKAVLPLDVEGQFLRKIAPLLDEESRKSVADRFAKEDVSKFRD